jgi:hypothetical protein
MNTTSNKMTTQWSRVVTEPTSTLVPQTTVLQVLRETVSPNPPTNTPQTNTPQSIQTTPVIVDSPKSVTDEKRIMQNTLWSVNDKAFFVVSSNYHNKNSQRPMGFYMSENLDKALSRFYVKVNYKNLHGDFQQGWINVTQMKSFKKEQFDTPLGQSTKGFVYKIMENLNRKIVGNNMNRDHQNHRGQQRGRGQRGRGRGQRGGHYNHQEQRGRHYNHQHQENHSNPQPQPQENEENN